MTQTDPSPHAREEAPQPILTVAELQALLTKLMFEDGLDADTAIVVANDGWYDEVQAFVAHPIDDEHVIWVTLTLGGPADPRFTPGHVRHEPDEDDSNEPVVDLVGRLFARFWTGEDATDAALSYKAGDYDACLWVAEQAHAIRPGLTWSDAAVRRAADLSYVMGQYGLDQATDRLYHVAMAVTIFELTEDDL